MCKYFYFFVDNVVLCFSLVINVLLNDFLSHLLFIFTASRNPFTLLIEL